MGPKGGSTSISPEQGPGTFQIARSINTDKTKLPVATGREITSRQVMISAKLPIDSEAASQARKKIGY